MKPERTVLFSLNLGKNKVFEIVASRIPSFPPNKNFFNLNIASYEFRIVPKNDIIA